MEECLLVDNMERDTQWFMKDIRSYIIIQGMIFNNSYIFLYYGVANPKPGSRTRLYANNNVALKLKF